MPDLKIRNVDKLVIAKLDQEAADRHMSREAFFKNVFAKPRRPA